MLCMGEIRSNESAPRRLPNLIFFHFFVLHFFHILISCHFFQLMITQMAKRGRGFLINHPIELCFIGHLQA